MGCLPYDITIKFYSWIAAIIYISIIAILFFIKMTKAPKEVKSQKVMYRSIALFLCFYIGVRIFFLFSDFERDANCESVLYFQFVFLGYICSIIAFLSIINFGETYVIRQTKHIFSYIIIISTIIDFLAVIFFPNLVNYVLESKYGSNYNQAQYEKTVIEVATIVRYFNYSIQYSQIFIILGLYLYLTMKSTGRIRRNSLITLIGLAISAAAAFLETDALLSSGLIPPFLSPIILCIGLTIFTFAYLRTI